MKLDRRLSARALLAGVLAFGSLLGADPAALATVVADDPTLAAIGPDDPILAAIGPDDPTLAAIGPDDPTLATVGPDDPILATTGPDDAILAEVRAFYREVAARDWPAVMTHVWPAKITARWEPPIDDPAWRTVALAIPSGPASAAKARCAGPGLEPTAVGRVGNWARVLVGRCSGAEALETSGAPAADEFWLLRVGGKWRIVRLLPAREGEFGGGDPSGARIAGEPRS